MDVFVHPHFSALYGEHPLVLADVGARGGLKKNWAVARPHLRVLSFEPDSDEFKRLEAGRDKANPRDALFNVALHNQSGSMTLHVARDAGLSSIFEPNQEFLHAFPQADRFTVVDRRVVTVDTLDRVLSSHRVTDLDFLKVDTQGSELLVLQGAAAALETLAIGVEVEAEFAPIYREQPLFADVDQYMRGLGFQLFDLRPCYWKRERGRDAGGPYGQIIWGDALYLKALPALRAVLSAQSAAARKAKVLKALTVALIYGYVDYALEVAHDFSDLLTADELKTIETALRPDRDARAAARVPGRRQLEAGLKRLATAVREPTDAWSISDPDLGNPPR